METMSRLLAEHPGRYATELGISVAAGPEERQKWFLAAIFFGARISGELAARTYRVFAERRVVTPEAILAQGWDNLVVLLDAGGYTRYDFKTATKLLNVMGALKEKHGGSLEDLHQVSRDYAELEGRIRALAPGIGPATANIFLRELREVWSKAIPPLSPLAQMAAEHLRLLPPGLSPEEALRTLESHWRKQSVPGFAFADLEAALVRLGLNLRRQRRGKI